MQFTALFILLSFYTIESNAVYESYISQYKNLAIQEMQRTGIPASIKLSQALLESNAGRSELAVKAKNHFGIKCGGSWHGETIYRNDDDFEKGKLIPSCFRKFSDVKESYIAHSEFLMDPQKNQRYGFLFDYSSTEYKKWARGLKKSGYATNSKYADLLIDIIERYRLYELDQNEFIKPRHQGKIDISKDDKPNIKDEQLLQKEEPAVEIVKENAEMKLIQSENDVDFIWVKPGDIVSDIAKRFSLPEKKIYTYNELLAETRGKIQQDGRIYLKQKRNNYRGRLRIHRVQPAESMYNISQMYGVKLKSLYKKNKMADRTQPAVGERIYIRGKRPKDDIVKLSNSQNLDKSVPISQQNVSESEINAHINQEGVDNETASDNLIQATIVGPKYYIVKKGDTLYNISKRFDLSALQLREMNGQEDNIIFVGQKIRVE